MANIATSTGASAPVYLTVVQLEESNRHPFTPEKISLDVTCRFDNGKGIFFILSPEIRQIVPWKVDDRLKGVGTALYHPAKPDLNLFENFRPWPMVPLVTPKLARKEQSMNPIIPMDQNHPLTMSSLEIAELVKARHDSVKRTIERLAENGVIALPPLVEKPDTGGRPGTYYVFDLAHKRDSFIVVAQLSPEFTAALVDRW